MIWHDIKISEDNTHFLFEGKQIFGKQFIEVLKFHAPGLAPVKDISGSYHIDSTGNPLYKNRFSRTFGYYCNRAAVVQGDKCFHITDTGERAYPHYFSWTGNFQENLCVVRGNDNKYFHINLAGEKIYKDSFVYCGDFKEGYACVKQSNGLFRHINSHGAFLNEKDFLDLGVFHKNYATAKDKGGWHHIDKKGIALYPERYLRVEPFYNGYSVVDTFIYTKQIIDESGKVVLEL